MNERDEMLEARRQMMAGWLLMEDQASQEAEGGSLLFDLGKPFKDFGKLLSANAKNISSSFWGTLGAIFALSDKTAKERLAAHRSRSQKYDSEAKSALADATAVLGNNPIFTFMGGGLAVDVLSTVFSTRLEGNFFGSLLIDIEKIFDARREYKEDPRAFARKYASKWKRAEFLGEKRGEDLIDALVSNRQFQEFIQKNPEFLERKKWSILNQGVRDKNAEIGFFLIKEEESIMDSHFLENDLLMENLTTKLRNLLPNLSNDEKAEIYTGFILDSWMKGLKTVLRPAFTNANNIKQDIMKDTQEAEGFKKIIGDLINKSKDSNLDEASIKAINSRAIPKANNLIETINQTIDEINKLPQDYRKDDQIINKISGIKFEELKSDESSKKNFFDKLAKFAEEMNRISLSYKKNLDVIQKRIDQFSMLMK